MPINQTINLRDLIMAKIQALDPLKAAKYFGKGEATIRKWMGGTADPGVGAAQKILDEIILQNGGSLPKGLTVSAPPEAAAPSSETKMDPSIPAVEPAILTDLREVFKDGIEQAPKWKKTLAEMGGIMIRVLKMGDDREVAFAIMAPENLGVSAPPKTEGTEDSEGMEKPNFSALDSTTTKGAPKVIEKPAPTPIALEPGQYAPSPFHLLMPTHRPINPTVMMASLANWKSTLPEEILNLLAPYTLEKDTMIHRARNILAQKFLRDGREWSFWQDSDIISPTGNPNWFKRRLDKKASEKINNDHLLTPAIRQLTSHGKKIVAGVYVERGGKGRLVASLDFSSKENHDQAMVIRRGTKKGLKEVAWAGFGCIAIHRQVFLDILEKCPEVTPKNEGEPPHFFTAFEGGPQGEDVAFCKRAAQAGHKTYLDLSVWCGHIGEHAYLP